MELAQERVRQLADKEWRRQNLYKVVDKNGKLIRFIPNNVQADFLVHRGLRNIILKVRQLGFTTLACIDMLDECLFTKHINAVIIAHDKESLEKIFRRIHVAWEEFEKELGNALGFSADASRANMLRFNNGSTISVTLSSRSDTVHLLHVCLSGDTDILLKNGYTKKIKDICEGDIVLNGNGAYSIVAGLSKKRLVDIGEKMLGIEIFGNYEDLKLTEGHKVLTRDFLTREPKWKEAKKIKKGDYIGFPVRNWSDTNWREFKDIDDFDFGYLLGFYLAEGSIRENELTLSIHENELEDVVNLVKKFNKYFTSFRTYHCKTSKTMTVSVNGKKLCEVIKKYCGSGKDKYLSDSLWSYGRQTLDGILLGYFKGDGSFKDVATIQVTSIRRQLLNQIKRLLISLRFGYPTIYHANAGLKYGRNCKETWILKLNGAGNWKFRKYFGLDLPTYHTKNAAYRIAHGVNPCGRKFWRRGRKYYWARITDVKPIIDEEFVYDIILDDEPHSYVTTSGVVHNSEFGPICAKYPHKAEEIITGAFPSVPSSGRITIESTADGETGAFHDMFWEGIENKVQHVLDFRSFFYSWTTFSEYQDFSKIPLPEKFLDYQQKHNLTDEQIRWYYVTWRTQKEKMKENYPTVAEEAFEASGVKVFDAEALAEHQRLYVKEGIQNGGWVFFEEYNPVHSYVIGGDPAEGIGKDSSSAHLIDLSWRDHGQIRPKVVGVFCDNTVAPDIFAYELKRAGQMYGNALIAVERNGNGLATLTVLKQNYTNLYMDHRRGGMEDKETSRLGFLTTGASKPMIIYGLRTAINESDIIIPDRATIRELRIFEETHLRSTKYDENASKHLDRVMSLAIAWEMRNFAGEGGPVYDGGFDNTGHQFDEHAGVEI